MAVLLEGLQGSGKSYYATYTMLHDADKYHKIFTNIDGIKVSNKIELLQFKDFMNGTLLELYEQQVEMDLSFDDCIEILKEKEILPENVSKDNRVLMVVDEAQNYFGKSVKLLPQLVWFITQHRHLFIELYLITQKYTLLRDDYKLFNVTYQAFPPVKQFNKKKIKYKEFAGLPYPPTNFVKNFTLPKEQEVFDMYVSGDKVNSPNILKRFGQLFIGFVLFLIAILYYFYTSYVGDTTLEEKTTQTVKKVVSSSSSPVKKEEDESIVKKFYTFVVWNDDAVFRIDGVNNDKEYPIKMLTYLKDEYFVKVIDKENDKWRTLIYVLCDVRMNDFLNEKEEKKTANFGEFSPELSI